jgi:hypothetical protein
MADNKYDLEDLVVAAAESKPSDFESAFDDIITGRIRAAVEDKKVQIAQQLYNYKPGEFVQDSEGEANTEEPVDGEETA